MNTCPCEDCLKLRDFLNAEIWLLQFQNEFKKESKNE